MVPKRTMLSQYLLVVCTLFGLHAAKGEGRCRTQMAAAFVSNNIAQTCLCKRRESRLRVNRFNLQTNPRKDLTTQYVLRRKKSQRSALDDEVLVEDSDDTNGDNRASRGIIRKRVKSIAKNLVSKPLALAATVPMPQAIGAILRDASFAAVEQVEDVILKNSEDNKKQALEESKEMVTSLIDEAFEPMEASLEEMEASLVSARKALEVAKSQSYQAIEAIQIAAIAQAEGAATAVAQAEKVAELQVMAEMYSSAVPDVDVSKLSFDDVDYESSEMAPPFLDPDSCLVPGEPVVRVEKAPENSRRIFAGIDILASVDDVWNVRAPSWFRVYHFLLWIAIY